MKKKWMAVIAVAAVAVVIALGVCGGMAIYQAEQQEIKRVQNLAGAVVTAYPETEAVFISAVMDQDFSAQASGGQVMSRYGYDENMMISGNYHKALYLYAAAMGLLVLALLVFECLVFFHAKKRREAQEAVILSMLDDCLSENFGFAGDESRLRQLDNPYFADSLVKLAHSLKLKTDRLSEERDNTKSMVTDISHQLKTPISAMRACFDMYLEADNGDEKNEFLNRSMIQMDKLAQLAAALVNISRLESKMIELSRSDIFLADILTGAVNTEYHKAAAKRIELAVGEFDDRKLYLDKKWTTEAIANIIDNGIKYSPAGSYIEIRVNKLFSFVRIEIEDQGIGIPKAERNKIFTRFFRGASEAVQAEEGSGVGLYLSRKIIEDQGGTVSVRSGKGGGSIFIVQIPL